MLQTLRIQNLAIIDDVELELDRGFTALTGETGAGKSILVDAINLLLGARASSDWIRTGAETAQVEAVFVLEDDARSFAEEMGIGFGDGTELVIKRSFGRSGKGKVFLNGSAGTVSMLERLSPRLIDIAGQHEHQTLLDPGSHLALVDAGANAELAAKMREVWGRFAAEQKEADALAARDAERARREDYLRFQVEELSKAAPIPGEEAALALERQRLAHAGTLEESLTESETALYSGDAAIASQLKTVHARLAAAARIDPALAPHLATLESARVEVEEVARSLRDYRRAEADPARLEAIEDRLALMDRLRKKHGVPHAAALAELLVQLESEILELTSLEAALSAAREKAAAARAVAERVAMELSRSRRRAGLVLARQVERELVALGMAHATFEVAVRAAPLSASGQDDVEFLISPNPGEDKKPLAKTASGGELSRVMLALKCIVAAHHPVDTYVFDEVDAGIGGAIAERVGARLAAIAGESERRHQVLCITHLAPIAARAGAHYRVKKSVHDGRTTLSVRALDATHRESEIARMLAGVEITDATRVHAREMLASFARREKRARSGDAVTVSDPHTPAV